MFWANKSLMHTVVCQFRILFIFCFKDRGKFKNWELFFSLRFL